MPFTRLLLWKHGSIMMHEKSQSSYQPGLNLASQICRTVALLFPKPHQMKCEWKWVWNVTIAWPRAYYNPEDQPLSQIILYLYFTYLLMWKLSAHGVHFCWYHMSTSFIGGSTYWFLKAFTQSFNHMWISLCLRLALVYWYKSVPGNRESGILWGSSLVWILVFWCCLICAVLVEGLVCVNKTLGTCHCKMHRGWEKNLHKQMKQSINNIKNVQMDQSSCLASHNRQKPKRGEDVFNAKIARITDGKWKKGLSVMVTWTRHYYSTTKNIKNDLHVTSNMPFTRLLLSKHGSIMMHEKSQSSYQPGLNLASQICRTVALLFPKPHQMKCEWKWVWNVTIAWPRAYYNPEDQPLSQIILYLYFTYLLMWKLSAHGVHFCWYHMSTSFIGGSTYWFLKAFTQSFNHMWISLCLRLALVYWYKSVPGNRESGILWGSSLVWILVFWCCLICAVLVEGPVCVNKTLGTCHCKMHRGWEKNLHKQMKQSINNIKNVQMDQSSCLASHNRQKPKRGEDVFNAKIARITDGKWKKGLSVTVTWSRHYYSTTKNIKNDLHVTSNMPFTRLLLWKHGSIMMHEKSQSSYQPGLNLASQICRTVALLFPKPHQMKCEWKWVWNVTIAWPRAYYNPEDQPLSQIILYLYFTYLLMWKLSAYGVHFCWYHMSTSFIGGSTYWFLKAFTQSFNHMWISLCLRLALVYLYKSVPGNRESGILWGSSLVWILVFWCCLICAVLVEGLVCVNKTLGTCHCKMHRGWEKNLHKQMKQSINNIKNVQMDQSSCLASHNRQKPKRGEDVFNAKIARITDGKWKKGLSVTVTWSRHYYSTTQNIKHSHVTHPTCPSHGYCCENMAQSCCMKYHKVHIDQASIWPATYEE